jgi:hypothetical protein
VRARYSSSSSPNACIARIESPSTRRNIQRFQRELVDGAAAAADVIAGTRLVELLVGLL